VRPRPPHVLEHALGAKSKVAALRALAGPKLGYSGSGVAKRSGMGLLAIQNALADLERLGLVEVERGAVEHRYRINPRHYLVTNGLLRLFEIERGMTRALASELGTLLEGKVLAAGLFGSFARGEVKAGSDIDLLVVVYALKERERISRLLSDASARLSSTYGLPIQPVILERRQLSGGKGNVKALLDEAGRDWVPVAGESLEQLRRSSTARTPERRRA
jgi:predicted nucleotidyltransferase